MKKYLFSGLLVIIFLLQCTSEETSSTDPQYSGKHADVIIDIGHGGKDPGAITSDGKFTEKDVVLQIGSFIYEELKKGNITALLTRFDDNFVSLKDRVEIVSNSNAKFILSLHVDMSNDTTKTGYVSYIQRDNPNSQKFAEYLHAELNKLNMLKDNGIEKGPFYMLKEPPVPSVILELGYMSNREDLNIITDKDNQDQIAKAITKAIIHFNNLNEKL